MLRAALRALRKNPRRNHLHFYCMVTAEPARAFPAIKEWEGVDERPEQWKYPCDGLRRLPVWQQFKLPGRLSGSGKPS